MARLTEEFERLLPELRKAVFSQNTDGAGAVKVTVRPVELRGERRLQLEYFRDNKVTHANCTETGFMDTLRSELDGNYRQVLISSGNDACSYCLKRDGSYRRTSRSTVPMPAGVGQTMNHNREKSHILCEGENIPALVDLGIFTPDFHIVKAKYDKYRQIDRFIRLVDDEMSKTRMDRITILDFGCGKSYLTFLLYYYFREKRGMQPRIIGYDLKQDVVEHCNRVAEKYGYEGLEFIVADVTRDRLSDEHIDMVVTLHACDTATDYALNYAMEKGAEYIFSVPCCQHEVNLSIQPAQTGDLNLLLEYGIVKERMSALLTDTFRAGILRDRGYHVDMIEFTDFEHTPKNIMLRARCSAKPGSRYLPELNRLAHAYGFSQTLLTLENQRRGLSAPGPETMTE